MSALSPGLELGVAWYLYPDEGHNSDGKHVQYLRDPQRWRQLDPELFDALKDIVAGNRSVSAVETSGLIDAKFSNRPLDHDDHHHSVRAKSRDEWFARVQEDLTDCDLFFALQAKGLAGIATYLPTLMRVMKVEAPSDLQTTEPQTITL